MASAGSSSAAPAPVLAASSRLSSETRNIDTSTAYTDKAEASSSTSEVVATTSSSNASGFLSSPSFPPSSYSRGSNSHASAQLSPRTPTTSVSTQVQQQQQHQQQQQLHPNLPSSPQQTAQARAALVGTISNLLDSELQSRASLLHQNARALEVQERDVTKATEALRKENDKLVKVIKDGSKKVLETGNVQNWAEVLERDFLVLEDTMRRVRRGSSGGCSDPDCSGCSCGTGSWSGSRTPSRRGSSGEANGVAGKGKEKDINGVVEPDWEVARDDVEMDEGTASRTSEQQSGSFATVNNAIAASISEAMATSICDIAGSPPAESEEVVEAGQEAAFGVTSKEGMGNDEDVVASPNRGAPAESTAMDVDDQAKVPVEVPIALDHREIQALEAIGLSPEVTNSYSNDRRIEAIQADTISATGEKMDIDELDETADSQMEPQRLS